MSEQLDDQPARLRKKPGRASRVASSGNGGGWKKRPIETLTCPTSGQQVQVRRPGPEFTLRAGKVARTFSHVADQDGDDDNLSPEERGLRVVSGMSDDELAAVMIFARELVCAMLVSPRLVQHPKSEDEIGPDDIGDDFWFLFNYAMTGFFGLRVPVGDREVEVADLKTFRDESGFSGDSDNSAEVRSDPEQLTGNSGLVAGV